MVDNRKDHDSIDNDQLSYTNNTMHILVLAAISCDAVSKSFGNFKAVDDVSLNIRDRTLQALIGPNGAGKTSLFNILSGEYQTDTGTIYLEARKQSDTRPHVLSHQGISRSFQITNLFSELTVEENVRLAV